MPSFKQDHVDLLIVADLTNSWVEIVFVLCVFVLAGWKDNTAFQRVSGFCFDG
jgi:hypothetical protein